MITGSLLVLTIITAVGCGLVGGVLFAFSSFVMPGLARAPAPGGVAAMQGINVAAVTPPFMVAFLGTALASAVLFVWTLVAWPGTAGPLLVIGALLYLAGVFALTALYHVPRNDALATVDPDGEDTPRFWSRYLADWSTWNHVRTAAALAAATLLTIALRVG